MAGIFINGVWSMGFDMDPTASEVFTRTPGGSATTSGTPFGTGYCWSTTVTSGINFNTNLTTHISGIRINTSSLPGTSTILLQLVDVTSGVVQISLRYFNDGHLQFYLGSGTGTTLGPASIAGLITINTWIFIECSVIISATVGQVLCSVNGTNVITTTATLNTVNSGANTWVSGLDLLGNGGGIKWDDWYMLDGTAASPLNAALGNVQVKGDKPSANSAVGGRNAYTPTNPQNDNHLNVGNIPVNTAQYNADSTPGDYDMFRFPALSAVTVFFLNEWVQIELDAAGARTVGLDCYSASGAPTDSLGTAFTPSAGTVSLYNNTYIVDPSGGSAWTVTNAGNAELGIKTIT